jgi:hypothetical protein
MPNLHAWITAKVDETEQAARNAAAADPAPWSSHTGAGSTKDGIWLNERGHEHGAGAIMAADDIWLWDNEGSNTLCMAAPTAVHVALHDPEAVLRRCEADRRILARHALNAEYVRSGVSFYATACDGCGYDDCGPNVENLNDCPELADLAHAHGITPDQLAALHRPGTEPTEPDDQHARVETTSRVLNQGPLT